MPDRHILRIDSRVPWISASALLIALMLGISILLSPTYIPFLLFGLLVVAITIVEKPETALFPLALTAPLIHVFIGFGRHPGVEIIFDRYNLLIVDAFSLIAVIAIILGRITGAVEPLRRHNFDLPILLLTSYATISLLWTRDFSPGLTVLMQFFSCIALFYAPVILLRGKKYFRVFLWIWLAVGIAAAVMAIITLYVKFHSITLMWFKYYFETYAVDFKYAVFGNIKQRVGGFGDPNRVAFLLNTAFFSGLVLFLTAESRAKKIAIGTIMFFILYTIMHTLSKGGIGSLIMAMTGYILLHKRFEGKVLNALAIFGIVIVSAFLLMSMIDLHGELGRFGQSPIESRGSSSLNLRFKWWAADLKAIVATNGLGTGIGGMSQNIWAYAQSSYFSLLAELGFIGFLLAAWFALTYAVELFSLLKSIRGDNFHFTVGLMCVAAVVVFLIHSTVDFGFNLRIPWLMAGVAVAAAEAGKRALETDDGRKLRSPPLDNGF